MSFTTNLLYTEIFILNNRNMTKQKKTLLFWAPIALKGVATHSVKEQ